MLQKLSPSPLKNIHRLLSYSGDAGFKKGHWFWVMTSGPVRLRAINPTRPSEGASGPLTGTCIETIAALL